MKFHSIELVLEDFTTIRLPQSCVGDLQIYNIEEKSIRYQTQPHKLDVEKTVNNFFLQIFECADRFYVQANKKHNIFDELKKNTITQIAIYEDEDTFTHYYCAYCDSRTQSNQYMKTKDYKDNLFIEIDSQLEFHHLKNLDSTFSVWSSLISCDDEDIVVQQMIKYKTYPNYYYIITDFTKPHNYSQIKHSGLNTNHNLFKFISLYYDLAKMQISSQSELINVLSNFRALVDGGGLYFSLQDFEKNEIIGNNISIFLQDCFETNHYCLALDLLNVMKDYSCISAITIQLYLDATENIVDDYNIIEIDKIFNINRGSTND